MIKWRRCMWFRALHGRNRERLKGTEWAATRSCWVNSVSLQNHKLKNRKQKKKMVLTKLAVSGTIHLMMPRNHENGIFLVSPNSESACLTGKSQAKVPFTHQRRLTPQAKASRDIEKKKKKNFCVRMKIRNFYRRWLFTLVGCLENGYGCRKLETSFSSRILIYYS